MQTSTARAAGNRTSLASTRPDKASEPLHDPPLGIIWRPPKGLQWNRLAAGTKIVEGHGDQMSAAANRNQPTRAVAENILVKEGKGKKGGGWAHSGAPTQRKSRPGEVGARPTQKTRDGADPGAKVEFTLLSKTKPISLGTWGREVQRGTWHRGGLGPGPRYVTEALAAEVGTPTPAGLNPRSTARTGPRSLGRTQAQPNTRRGSEAF